MSIYFDNSATTCVSAGAAEKALSVMVDCYGNPSSLHTLGFAAQKELSLAREAVAAAMGAKPEELTFTSGGTESNNLAILGAARAKKRLGNRILTSAIEHPSVLGAMAALEKEGFTVTYLSPKGDGNIHPEQVAEAMTKDTILVSLMAVNNETGAILPLGAVKPAIKNADSQALFHVDNVQGFGKIKLNLKQLGIDLMSASGHKIHAPKGVGALYMVKGARISPCVFGGGQEKSIRPGTENLPGIAAMGVATNEMDLGCDRVGALNAALRRGIAEIPGTKINSPETASPYILNFYAGRVRGETLVHFLAEQEMYVSTGSACTGGKPSHVLTAMGIEKREVESALRVSFSTQNTEKEIAQFLSALKLGLQKLCYN